MLSVVGRKERFVVTTILVIPIPVWIVKIVFALP